MCQTFLPGLQFNHLGTYDIGIQQLHGKKIEFVGNPRTFCFRGLDAKDERVHVYQVALDSGFTSEMALNMYNAAKTAEQQRSSHRRRNGWLGRGVREEIESGFYLDQRDYLKQNGGYGKKVFLVVNPGAHNDKCIVVRPNSGRCMMAKHKIRTNLSDENWTHMRNVDDALDVWNKEFDLADCSSSEKYQFSCAGRHGCNVIFTGQLVPILNKLLKACGDTSSSGKRKNSNICVFIT